MDALFDRHKLTAADDAKVEALAERCRRAIDETGNGQAFSKLQ